MADNKNNGAASSNNDAADTNKNEEKKNPQVSIQRIYIKDSSFESPASPKIFLDKWQPEMNINLSTKTNALGEDNHEVVLTVGVTVKDKEKTAFLIEVQQAGIFAVKNLEGEVLKQALAIFCPNVLYPYARQVISELAANGGFPQLYLAPVNFESLYAQAQKQKAANVSAAEDENA